MILQEHSSLEEWSISNSVLRAMEADVRAAYKKALWFVYNPGVAATHHGSQAEYSDGIAIAFSVEGADRDYVLAHELGHALRNSRPGSLQLLRAVHALGRREASAIASVLEHPSVMQTLTNYGFEIHNVILQRAADVLEARSKDNDFLSGKGVAHDFMDIITLVEFSGAYACKYTEQLKALYEQARPSLIPRAADVSRVVEAYTNGERPPIECAIECANIMQAPLAIEHFTTRDDEWVQSLKPRPQQFHDQQAPRNST